MKKFLIIPGFPLLVIITAIHDETSPLAVFLLCVTTAILTFGASFILLYALARLILFHINQPHP